MVCHQRKIRDALMAENPRPVQTSLDGCEVLQITVDEAKKVILEYEWLGTMPTVGRAYYGLIDSSGEIVGVACFGEGMGTAAKNVCGPEYAPKAICLERGACVHWAHPHAASFLISRACRKACTDHGWNIFFAYSDSAAGEIGTVYQACNWVYIGQGSGRGSGGTWRYQFIRPDGKVFSSRAVRARYKAYGIKWDNLRSIGWKRERIMDKGKYVHFAGPKAYRKELEKNLRYEKLPYPKRK